jgi:S-DNA-T family DNA segregation ATPase FtsK/SpoIIIE
MGRTEKKALVEDVIGEVSGQSDVSAGVKRSIGAVLAFVLSVLLVLGFFDLAGPLGQAFDTGIGLLFGWGKWISPIIAFVTGIFLIGKRPESWSDALRFTGLGMAFVGLLGIFHFFSGDTEMMLGLAEQGKGGGLLGFGLAFGAISVAGSAGGIVLLAMFFLIGCIAAFNVSLLHWVGWIRARREGRETIDSTEMLDADEEVFNEADESDQDSVGEEDTSPAKGIFTRRDERKDYTEDGLSLWEAQEDGYDANANTSDVSERLVSSCESTELEQANIGAVHFPGDQVLSAGLALVSNAASENASGDAAGGDEMSSSVAQNDELPVVVVKKPRKRIIHWKMPPHSLVERHLSPQDRTDGKDRNADIIRETLRHFGIEVELGSVQVGPTVTQYTFRPATGVKLSRITTLNNDLALALAASSIRIEAPIPGKSLVGIEVPNHTQSSVRFRSLLESREVHSRKDESLLMVLGKDVSGGVVTANLDKLPHLLIAGATNSGKSVCINTLLLSLLYRNTPDDLQLILVDPKRVELTPYNKIPHLKTDVIVEPKKVVNILRWAVSEMERRYKILEESQSRDIHSYRTKRQAGGVYQTLDPSTNRMLEQPLDAMPFIVIVIDEMADLMMGHGKDVEGLIVRLAQMSRAVGIHLILATQRPSVEVITGLIKANIIARIAFQVATQIDSRTILDMSGAEKLLGKGDMLFLAPTAPQPRRIQGVFVSEEEVRRVTNFWREQAKELEEDIPESFEAAPEAGDTRRATALRDSDAPDVFDIDTPQVDERYEEAKQIVIETGKASASLLQRRMSVGYSRAARILDELEAGGIIGPADGAKARTIFVGKGAKNQDMVGYEDETDDQKTREKWTA